MTYKLTGKHTMPGMTDEDINIIIRKSDGTHIPKSLGNRDYQEYLEWVDAGNTPEAAD